MVYPHLFRTEHSETKTTNAVYGEYHASAKNKKIAIPPELLQIVQYVDSNREAILSDLAEFVAIPSVAADLTQRDGIVHAFNYVERWLINLRLKYEVFHIGYKMQSGQKLRLPPIIFATTGRDPGKKTICIYGHVDVKVPDCSVWETKPFTLTDKEKYVQGSGVTSGKGPLLAWFHIVRAFQKSNQPLPVNIMFVIEGMFHEDSEGLADFLNVHKHDIFSNIDSVVVVEGEWIGKKRPCLIYGCVGCLKYTLTVHGNGPSAENQLESICRELINTNGQITIPHFYDLVQQVTPEEEKMYEAITDFDVDEAKAQLSSVHRFKAKEEILMDRWRRPSIWLDPIECSDETGTTKRHFSTKIVPKQIAQNCADQTIGHIKRIREQLGIENRVDCVLDNAKRHWYESTMSVPYQAAKRAIIQIYKEEPHLIREDRERVVSATLDQVLEKPVVMIPLGIQGSNSGLENENITKRYYYEGMKLFAAYLFQISLL